MGEGLKKEETEPAVGIPYYVSSSTTTTTREDGQRHVMAPPYQQQIPYPNPNSYHQYLGHDNPYQRGMIPPTAIFDRIPYRIPLQETIFRDTPAPFECPDCGAPGLTAVKSKPSLAACVACLVSVVGVCFICPSFDCLWHKEHYCPSCGHKVAEFTKSDPCAVMDATQWSQPSFALPA